jgi:hypothetical protein
MTGKLLRPGLHLVKFLIKKQNAGLKAVLIARDSLGNLSNNHSHGPTNILR